MLAATRLSAQDLPQTPKKYKWEVAVDVNHHIFKESSNAPQYFVRMLKSNNQAWRFSLDPTISNFYTSTQSQVRNFSGKLDIGHEWAKSKGDFRIYYGLGLGYVYGNLTRDNQNVSYDYNQVSLYGLGGLQYRFYKSFSASLEMQSVFSYRNEDYFNSTYALYWSQAPIAGIYLGYQF